MHPVHLPPLGCMVTIVRVITSFSCDFVVRSLSGGIFYCQYCRLLQQPWRRLPCSGRLRRSQHSCRVVRVLIGPLPFSCTLKNHRVVEPADPSSTAPYCRRAVAGVWYVSTVVEVRLGVSSSRWLADDFVAIFVRPAGLGVSTSLQRKRRSTLGTSNAQ